MKATKSRIGVAMLTLFAFTGALQAAEGKHLFILSGQSNMQRLDPKTSFTPAVEAAYGKDKVIVVKDAQGAQPIRRWYKKWKPESGDAPAKTGDLYDRMMGKVTQAIAGQKIATVTFVWMQGERDAKEKHGHVYAASLKGLVKQLADDMKRTDINFVVGRINDYSMNNKSHPHWTVVREAQVKAVEEMGSRAAWVDTDDLNGSKNDIHATRENYTVLGKRFAEKAMALIKAASGGAK